MRLRDAAWSLLERMNARMDQSTEGSHTHKKSSVVFISLRSLASLLELWEVK